MPSGVITLQQGLNGYLGGEDTYIFQERPDELGHYTQASLFVGYKQKYAGLLRFDLSPLLANTRITRATLQLYGVGWSGANISASAYAISRTATLSETTWNQARTAKFWAMAGCNDPSSDRRANPEATIITTGLSRWYSLDLTSLAQGWQNGDVANNGILLRGDSLVADYFLFASAEYGTSELRPRLVIEYEGVAAPTPTAVPTLAATKTPTLVPTPTRTATPTLPPSLPITVTLQQGLNGYTGTEDTYLYRDAPDVSYHAYPVLRVGQKQQYAMLLRFDLSLIPSNAVVTWATLQIYGVSWSTTGVGMGAYTVLRSTDLSQATWSRAQIDNPWAVAGCDSTITDRRARYESGAMTTGAEQWSVFTVTSAVQEWVGGRLANNGFLLRAILTKYTDYVNFASSEFSDEARRPRLVITYHLPGGSSPPSLVIGHITDVHVGGTVVEPLVGSALRTLSNQAQVLVDTGDCTQDGTVDQTIAYWELVSANATVPWHAVQGNHDSAQTFTAYINPLEWFWDVGGYRLIGINSWALDYTALDQALTMERRCVVFGHLPLGFYSAADQAALRQRFQAYDVLLYVAGHAHLDSLAVDPQSGTLLLVGRNGNQGGYRLITLRGAEVSVTLY